MQQAQSQSQMQSQAFPRSVALCARELDGLIAALAALIGETDTPMPTGTLEKLRRVGRESSIEVVLEGGLHEYLDQLQRHLMALTDEFGGAIFGHHH